MSIAIANRRCTGRRPVRLHDLRATPTLGLFLKAATLPPLPASGSNWFNAMKWPTGPMLNLQIGLCTIAAMGHLVQLATANTGAEFTPPDSDILAGYETVTALEGQAYNPNAPLNAQGENPTDTGCALIDVVKYFVANGLSGHKFAGYLAVNPKNQLETAYAIYLFGNVIDGVNLTSNALNNVQGGTPAAPGVWDIPEPRGLFHRRQQPQYIPDPTKGHAILAGAQDAQGNVLYDSWGDCFLATPAWQAGCVEERYVLIPADWEANTVAPNGLDVTALNSYLAALPGVS
jgi:hypothetical protein